ncbi:MAG: hypothetical protein KAH20_07430 [Methylococcales bacterium]|nr:hypothetical protein [Methylococcales bacterium]
MKYAEPFVVYISIQTSKGHRYIYYTAVNQDYGLSANGNYIHHGLGTNISDNSWHTLTRDLAADLAHYEPGNQFIALNGFLIRGSGFVDEIETLPSIIPNNQIYGVTLDTIDNIDASVDAVGSLSKEMTTRVVFDTVPASIYTSALSKLSRSSYIMGQLFDSEYIKQYTPIAYQVRVNEYLDLHGDIVDIWEIGNEVNGEWTGDNPDLVAQKTVAAYQKAKNRGYQTALTLYYNDFVENDGCWSKEYEKMRPWAKTRLNNALKNGIDYILVSYYEEDCNYHQPSLSEWNNVFNDLGKIFPNAKLGFGEVGTTTTDKEAYLSRYYSLSINHPRFIGGYFWWYFKDDMTPKSKPLWSKFNQILETLQ